MTKILVVDDDHNAADSLAFLLERMGYEVHTCYLGQEALDCVERLAPQIVFLDLVMKGVDGFEVARQVRGSPAAGSPFLVALTARVDRDVVQATKDAGFDLYVAKPTDVAVLIMIVESLEKRVRATDSPS